MAENIFFHQGADHLFNEKTTEKDAIEIIKKKIFDLSNIKNINFLLGAGASADAIPDMKALPDQISKGLNTGKNTLVKKNYADLKAKNKSDLESILGALYAKSIYNENFKKNDKTTEKLINLIKKEIFNQINISFKEINHKKSLTIYKKFYQKITHRNKDLSRANIFTTNNDLLSEKALDELNINFSSGFGGGIERFFNPARFSYTFSRKIDSSNEKFESIDNMVYLYKLHGSINWIENFKSNSFFKIQEVPINFDDSKSLENVMIYPTPLKQNKSLGSPYSDLIREFQKKILLPHSVLFIIGYSFRDEHINNIIYQALASNSTINIVIFGNYTNQPIFKFIDRRIYKIYGEIDDASQKKIKIHYFDYIVKNFLPDLEINREDEILQAFIDQLAKKENK